MRRARSGGHGVLPALLAPELVPLELLDEDEKNARAHDERSIETARGNLEEFGQHAPLVGVRRPGASSSGSIVVRIGNGRLKMARELRDRHPDVVTVSRKWGRWQHHVDYRRFKRNRLRLRPDIVVAPGSNEYGMTLQVDPPGGTTDA